MSDLAIGLRQVRAEQRAFWRNRAAALFGFGFPIMFLLIFGTIFNKQSTCVDGTIGASGQCVGAPRSRTTTSSSRPWPPGV